MPLRPIGKEEKKDHKQILIDLIAQKYGSSNAMVMEKAFKTQDKQIEEAMMQGGATADAIAEKKGIDLGMLNQLVQQSNTNLSKSKSNETTQESSFPKGLAGLGATLSMTGAGLQGRNPYEILESLAKIQNQQQMNLSPQSQIDTLKKTQGLLKESGIKAKVDITATGVPTISTQPELGMSDLNPSQQIQAVSLARKYATGRKLELLIPSIAEEMMNGKTIDQIEDSLRLAGQSEEFSGAIRGAMQNITSKWSPTEKQTAFDEIDDYSNDPETQKQAIKRTALQAATVDQQNQIMGKERTVDLLKKINGDLETLEKNGTSTNWMTGNIEGLLGRVGLVKNPAMREVATKIAVAVMAYRRSMTGVQFGMIENKEYKRIFPNIDKVNAFNSSVTKALTSIFTGDTQKFYKQKMGDNNYNKIFGSDTQEQQKETKQLDKNTAMQLLKESGGDKNKARELAKQRGYQF